ncbi:acyl carrier protein [Chromobacterium sp. IIBBL 290-4]|uniref:acyl carrier protein n=1 Tax=Chromobacterium sp. IIBBL 290-4 TaxID=2953890 RepID=UPI0020B663FA|nr:acyl carrier protein [Chromobacterium sp. IIBBL 290-4]UTH76441.1 acyl carrier protein [Chromobacterium sp. IIBBL 290-4]
MTQNDVFNLMVKHTREVLPWLQEHEFHNDVRLVDLGANSVDRVEIVVMTLEALSLKLPLVATQKAQNLDELAALLHAHL